MKKQAATFEELAAVMEQLSEGEDVPMAKETVSDLVAQLMTLKEESLTLEKPGDDPEVEALQNHKAYGEAVEAYFKAQKKLTESGKLNADILAALQGFHKAPVPQVGEGRN